MGQNGLKEFVQAGGVKDMLYIPEDEFKNDTIFSEETSTSVCGFKNLSKNEIVKEFEMPTVEIDRAYDRIEDSAIFLLKGKTSTEKGDPAT
jgi:hypothetical protein